eukprot:4063032-Alexandrium_andersonii.AAC.1
MLEAGLAAECQIVLSATTPGKRINSLQKPGARNSSASLKLKLAAAINQTPQRHTTDMETHPGMPRDVECCPEHGMGCRSTRLQPRHGGGHRLPRLDLRLAYEPRARKWGGILPDVQVGSNALTAPTPTRPAAALRLAPRHNRGLLEKRWLRCCTCAVPIPTTAASA